MASPADSNNNANAAEGLVVAEQEFSPPTTEQLNMRCTGVKRLLKEAAELRHPNELFCAKPMEDNLFEWHFTVRGPPDTPYAEGVYHGRIVLPAEYPMKPPNLILLTPNGRFETNKKICLSISGYHPETWLPSWSIRTALLALIGFMPTHSAGALGGLECSREERRRLAIKSLDWRCEACGVGMRDALPTLGSTGRTERLLEEVRGAAAAPASSSSDNKASTQSPVLASTTNAAATGEQLLASSTTSNSAAAIGNSLAAGAPAQPAAAVRQASPSAASPPLFVRLVAESPLFWIALLAVFLVALVLRRVMLPAGNNSNFGPADMA